MGSRHWRHGNRVAVYVLASVAAGLGCWLVGQRPDPREFAAAAALACLVTLAGIGARRAGLPAADDVMPFGAFLVIVVLRDSAGGTASGFGTLLLLPVLWIALYRSRTTVVVSLVAYALTQGVPILLIGGAAYPADWRRFTLGVAVAVILAASVKRLVSRVQAHADALERQAELLHQAEQGARTARDLFAGVLSAATEASIIATETSGTITVFNEGAQRMLGYSAAEMVGVRTPEVLHLPEEIADRARELGIEPGLEAVTGDARRSAETREWTYVRKDGSHVPVSLTVTARHDDAGDVVGFIGVATDITERHAERARAHAIIESQAHIAAAGLDAEAAMERIAERATELTGAHGAVVEMVDGDDLVYTVATGALAPFRGVRVARGTSLSGLSVEQDVVLRCDDTELDDRVDREMCRRVGLRSMVVVPLRTQAGVLGVLKVGSPAPHAFSERAVETLQLLAHVMSSGLADAQAYRRVADANARLVELDRLKDRFVATVSHELRTPLAGIIASAEMLADGDGGTLSPTQAQLVSMIDRNSERLLSQIENLLEISRIESGVFRSRPAATDLGRLIASAVDAMRSTAAGGSVSLVTDVEPDIGEITADPGQLDRVLVNLLSNAVKFTPEGGEVALVARREGGAVEVSVTDTGIGIPADEVPLLFGRFFRASTAEQQAIPGSGLGLAIVKEIVDGHHGTIDVESTPGIGTRFTVRLPADPPVERAAEAAA